MRRIMRFLILGAVVFGGLLLSGSRPAIPIQTSEKFGTYAGTYVFVVEVKTHEFHEEYGTTWLDDVEIDWSGVGTIELHFPPDGQSTATVLSEHVNIFQYADATLTSQGGNCSWQDALTAKGKYGKSWTLFDRDEGSWDTSVIWNKITSYQIKNQTSSGSMQFCQTAGQKLSNVQKVKAVEKVTRTIDLIRFKITSFNTFQISGTCSFPNWEGTYPTQWGSSQHNRDDCDWQVFRKNSSTWKNPLLVGQNP